VADNNGDQEYLLAKNVHFPDALIQMAGQSANAACWRPVVLQIGRVNRMAESCGAGCGQAAATNLFAGSKMVIFCK